MSWHAYDWVWASSSLTGTARLVMLAIADHADDAGCCWPSVDRLAEMCRVERKTVMRAVKAAEEAGELIVRRADTPGRGRVNRYTLTFETAGQATSHPGTIPAVVHEKRRSLKVPSGDQSPQKGPICDQKGPTSDQKRSHPWDLNLHEPPGTPRHECEAGWVWIDRNTRTECPACHGQGCD